jgi:hypothetical protein
MFSKYSLCIYFNALINVMIEVGLCLSTQSNLLPIALHWY